jgi:hypothetical protein
MNNNFTKQGTTYCAPGQGTTTSTHPLFNTQQVDYCKVLQEHKGECDLLDDIEPEMVTDGNYHDHVRIRKLQNDELFPYNTDSFVTWYEMKRIEPHTRESLVYLKKRVNLKKKLKEKFGDVKRGDVTEAFVDECLETGWQAMVEGKSKNDVNVLKARGFVDLAALCRNGFIHAGMDFEATKNLMKDSDVGSWLLRKSSIHGNLMKNAEIVVLAYVKNVVNGFRVHKVVSQLRLLHVYGVGWFECSERYIYTSFKLFGAKRTNNMNVGANPDHATLLDVIMEYQSEGGIKWDKVIKANPESSELDELD